MEPSLAVDSSGVCGISSKTLAVRGFQAHYAPAPQRGQPFAMQIQVPPARTAMYGSATGSASVSDISDSTKWIVKYRAPCR